VTLHLLKLCVGATSVEDLAAWVDKRTAANARGPFRGLHDHVTRMFPKKVDELLDGGSLYWVIRGVVLVRQKIVRLESVEDDKGVVRCAILLDPTLVPVEAQPRRAFQGWRYLKPADAPADLGPGARQTPPALRARLAELGLL
jgi:hypothetical protein